MKAKHYSRLLKGAARVEWQRRRGKATVPYKVEFITTYACASRCRTCNIWKRYIEDPEEQAREMTCDDIGRTVASGRDHIRWVSLTGGEITDRPDIIDIVKRIVAEVGDRLALLQFTTNGIDPAKTEAIFPELFEVTRGIPVYVTLSLDGIGKTYERVRGVPRGYEKVMASMDIIKRLNETEKHVTTGFQITLSELNVHEASDLFEKASEGHERPIITMATNALQLTRGNPDIDVRRASEDVEEALREVWKRYPKVAINDLPPTLHLGLTRQYFRTGRAPIPCSAGHSTLTFDPYGGVLQCDSRATTLARLQDYDFDLVALCEADAFRDALAPLSDCRECWTPCQAYPSIMHHPVSSLWEYTKAVITG
jgi:MoaA/NifB/PqqE/SkfB family radical SAM enzyme